MKTWKTKDGKIIPIRKLADSHLLNILHMLARQAVAKKVRAELVYLACPKWMLPRGDMAQMAFDEEFDRVLDTEPADYLPPIWKHLIKEAVRRKLDVPAVPDDAVAGAVTLGILSKIRPARSNPPHCGEPTQEGWM